MQDTALIDFKLQSVVVVRLVATSSLTDYGQTSSSAFWNIAVVCSELSHC